MSAPPKHAWITKHQNRCVTSLTQSGDMHEQLVLISYFQAWMEGRGERGGGITFNITAPHESDSYISQLLWEVTRQFQI